MKVQVKLVLKLVCVLLKLNHLRKDLVNLELNGLFGLVVVTKGIAHVFLNFGIHVLDFVDLVVTVPVPVSNQTFGANEFIACLAVKS